MGPAPKKRKVFSSTELAELVEELNEKPREKANNVPIVISYLTSKDHQVLPLIQGLKLYFVGCFEREELSSTPPASSEDPQAVYAAWLHRQFSSCVAALLANIQSGTDARTQVASLAALMEFTRGKRVGIFDNELFFKIASCILTSAHVAPEVIGSILEKYAVHADIYYHLLRVVSKLCKQKAARPAARGTRAAEDDSDDDADEAIAAAAQASVSAGDFARNVYDLLSQLPPPSEDPFAEGLQSWCGAAEVGIVAPAGDASGPRQRKKLRREQEEAGFIPGITALTAKWASPKLHRKAYSEAWMNFLRLGLPDDVYRKVLSRMHTIIIPNLVTPLLLSDFLTHSLDRGGLDGILALNGIFILVTQHGLEYPKFYERLYGLLTLDTFLSKHRLRFFQLADIFLASPMVPAYTAAAFAKKFARLALRAPPAGALIAIVFIHNLVRRHPACVQLVHRAPPKIASALIDGEGEQQDAKNKAPVWRGEDVYDENEADPAKARALESSLWELTALRNHSDPSVSSYCSILDKDLTDRRRTAEIDVSDVLSASYVSLFTREAERRLKQVPSAFYAKPPEKVFSNETEGGVNAFAGWNV